MALDSGTSKKLVICLLFLAVMFGSVVVFWHPEPGGRFTRADVLILGTSLFLMFVMVFNMFQFTGRMKGDHPAIAKLVAALFPIGLGGWFYSHTLFQYNFELGSVIRILVLCAVASTAMNLIAYLYLKRRRRITT